MTKVYGYFDRVSVKLDTGSDSFVQQHHAETCDMRVIISKFLKTGDQTVLNQRQKQYLDCTSASDYDTALQTVIDAQDAFYSLPAHVRERFNNDPSQLLEFVDNEDNLDEAIKLGLAERNDVIASDQDKTSESTNETISDSA